MRNPKWQRDEVILALDLYFKLKPGEISAKNHKIIELSSILNKLPIHSNQKTDSKYRNANGVSLKLSNFLSIDPNYHGKGMVSFSKLDKEVFEEFFDDKSKLIQIANQIKEVISDDHLKVKLYEIGDENDEQEHVVKEGKIIYKIHKSRERDQSINKKKKNIYFRKNKKLDCEVCGFDFYKIYGDLGLGYIECHHKVPLSELSGETKTNLNDLVLVCANCHRMLHRNINTMSIEGLKNIIGN